MNNQSYYGIHQDLMKEVQMAVQDTYNTARLFPMVNGLFYSREGNPIKVGTNGMPDLAGFVDGLAIYVEIKSGKSRIIKNSDQGRFRRMCNRFGVIHIEATSVKQFLKELDAILTNLK